MPQILTPKQVADRLQLHIDTVYDMLRRGDLPGGKIGGSWRINERDLYEMLDRQSQEKVVA